MVELDAAVRVFLLLFIIAQMFDIVAWWGEILMFGGRFCMITGDCRVFQGKFGWGILWNWVRLGLDKV